MNLLVIEDEARVADLIRRGFEEEGWRVDVATDGFVGQQLALQQTYDALITDILLPGVDGLTLCRHIRQARPQLPIVMLTALGTTDDKVEGFDAGADDYLVKPFDFRELHVRLRTLLKRYAGGAAITSKGPLQLADLLLDPKAKTVQRGGRDIILTPKEFKLLEYLLRHAGQVVSRVDIAEQVWDTHFDTGTNFIDVYINYLRRKVDRDFAVKLIHTRPGMGFLLKVET